MVFAEPEDLCSSAVGGHFFWELVYEEWGHSLNLRNEDASPHLEWVGSPIQTLHLRTN